MASKLAEPAPANRFQEQHVLHVFECLKIWSGIDLMAQMKVSPENAGEYVWNAPFFLISQNADADPILTYGNRRVLGQWECTWEQLTSMPSRKTANDVNQAQRNQAMAEVVAKGFVMGYSGDRVSRTGREFHIENGIIWNLFDLADEGKRPAGRAAFFASVTVKPA